MRINYTLIIAFGLILFGKYIPIWLLVVSLIIGASLFFGAWIKVITKK